MSTAHVARPGRLRDGVRILVQQGLPTAEVFPGDDVDLVHWRALHRHFYVSRSPRHVEQVFIEGHDHYRKATHYRLIAAVTGEGLLTNEGEPWAKQRRLIQPTFAKRHLDNLVPPMTAATADFLDRFHPPAAPATTDVAAAMVEVTLDVVGRALFGTGLADNADRLRPAVATGMDAALLAARLQMALGFSRRFIDVAGRLVFRTPIPNRVRKAMHTIDDVVTDLVRTRAAEGRPGEDDLLDLLLGATDEQGAPMSQRQVRDELVTMMLAGHETTANALSWLWYLLAQHPEARARVEDEVDRVLGGRVPTGADIDELHWTRACLQEAMRLYPPAWVLEREVTQPTQLDGETLRRKATVIFLVHLIHRDPRWWDAPDEFRPERFLPDAPTPARGTYLPFGAGRRICVAAQFALTEGTLIAAMVAQRHRFDLPPDAVVQPAATVTLRPRRGLPMTVTSRA